MFLSQDELKTVVDVNLIDKITASDSSIVGMIINESIQVMKSYLSKYYDVENIFNKEEKERNLTVLKRLKDIVIYEIYIRHTKAINEVAASRYNEAINWLEKLNTGEFADKSLPIPAVDIEPVEMTIRSGSNKKYTSTF